jgi:Ca2+-binding RTX toxin-like protein
MGTFSLIGTEADDLLFDVNGTGGPGGYVGVPPRTGSFIDGLAGNDTISVSSDAGDGTIENYTIQGGANNDQINLLGTLVNSVVQGGLGNDSMTLGTSGPGFGGSLDSFIYGGSGNDTIRVLTTGLGAAGFTGYQGGGGNDLLAFKGVFGSSALRGGSGRDSILFEETTLTNQTVVTGGSNNDLISNENESGVRSNVRNVGGLNTIAGAGGDDTLDFFSNTGGADAGLLLYGDGLNDPNADRTDEQDGDDCIIGGQKNDTIYGGGNTSTGIVRDGTISTVKLGDFLQGNNGADLIFGEDGNDYIQGNNGDDTINGGDNNDLIFGENAFDYYLDRGITRGGMYDQSYEPFPVGKPDAGFQVTNLDEFFTADDSNLYDVDDTSIGDFDNLSFGFFNEDELDGDSGNDTIFGGGGSDTLFGGNGNDILEGNSQDDVLDGQNGADVLIGGTGADLLTGGAGPDIFVQNRCGISFAATARNLSPLPVPPGPAGTYYEDSNSLTYADGIDIITDLGVNDKIDVEFANGKNLKGARSDFDYAGFTAYLQGDWIAATQTFIINSVTGKDIIFAGSNCNDKYDSRERESSTPSFYRNDSATVALGAAPIWNDSVLV